MGEKTTNKHKEEEKSI